MMVSNRGTVLFYLLSSLLLTLLVDGSKSRGASNSNSNSNSGSSSSGASSSSSDDQRTVTFNIEFGGYNSKSDLTTSVEIEDCDSSAMEAFERAALELGINFDAKYYSQYGYFVSEIDGVTGDTSTQTYWFIFVNDEFSQVGISSIQLNDGDTFTWSYELCGQHC